MKHFSPLCRRFLRWPSAAALLLCMATLPSWAEKADKFQKMEVESDQPGRVDLQKQIVVFNGNVVVTKGTMTIRAARIEVRESPDGYQHATATGKGHVLASFRQKRDGLNEFIEGEAERLDYDGKADTIRFTNRASVKRLRGSAVADEVTGAVITYDNTAELFTVAGSTAPAGAASAASSGRVRAVISPREGTPAAREAAASAASSPAPSPATTPSVAPGARR